MSGCRRNISLSSRWWRGSTSMTSASSCSWYRCREGMKMRDSSCRFFSCSSINKMTRGNLDSWVTWMMILRWQGSVKLTWECFFLVLYTIKTKLQCKDIIYMIEWARKANNINFTLKKISSSSTWSFECLGRTWQSRRSFKDKKKSPAQFTSTRWA